MIFWTTDLAREVATIGKTRIEIKSHMAAAPSLPGLGDAGESIIFWNTQHFDPEDGMEVEVESYAEEYAPREAKRTVAARLQEMAENVFLCEVIGGGKKFGTKGYPSRRKQKAQLGLYYMAVGISTSPICLSRKPTYEICSQSYRLLRVQAA